MISSIFWPREDGVDEDGFPILLPRPKGLGRTRTGGVFVAGEAPSPCIKVGRGPDAFGYGWGVIVCWAIIVAKELEGETGFWPLGSRVDVGVIAPTDELFDQLLCGAFGRITVAACAFAIVFGVS